MTVLAAIRPDDVSLALFVHVLGAMLLVGTLLTVAWAGVVAPRGATETARLDRMAMKTLLLGVLPAYVLMRVGAHWTEAQEDLPESVQESAWITIGYVTAELGVLLIVASVVASAIGLRRPPGRSARPAARAVGIIAVLLLVAYVVAIWAMSAKPG